VSFMRLEYAVYVVAAERRDARTTSRGKTDALRLVRLRSSVLTKRYEANTKTLIFWSPRRKGGGGGARGGQLRGGNA
jgi:hypothetical protein